MSATKSLTEIHQAFIADLQTKHRSHSTILAYSKDTLQLLELVAQRSVTDLNAVIPDDIENFKTTFAAKDYNPKSIARKINSIKSFFHFCQKNGWLKSDPTVNIKPPRYDSPQPRILTKMEYRALRDTTRNDCRLEAVIELLLQTGLRIGELSRLKVSDINFDKGEIQIESYQSQPSRIVPLNKAAQKATKKYLEKRIQSKNGNLFLTKTGRCYLVRNIRSAINRCFRLAGINHAKVGDLRHTFICHQLQSGVPLTLISQIIGHKRLSTTEKYLQFLQKSPSQRVDLEEL